MATASSRAASTEYHSFFYATTYRWSAKGIGEVVTKFQLQCSGATCFYDREHHLFEMTCVSSMSGAAFKTFHTIIEDYVKYEVWMSQRTHHLGEIELIPECRLIEECDEEDDDEKDEDGDEKDGEDNDIKKDQKKVEVNNSNWNETVEGPLSQAWEANTFNPQFHHQVRTQKARLFEIGFQTIDSLTDGLLTRILWPSGMSFLQEGDYYVTRYLKYDAAQHCYLPVVAPSTSAQTAQLEYPFKNMKFRGIGSIVSTNATPVHVQLPEDQTRAVQEQTDSPVNPVSSPYASTTNSDTNSMLNTNTSWESRTSGYRSSTVVEWQEAFVFHDTIRDMPGLPQPSSYQHPRDRPAVISEPNPTPPPVYGDWNKRGVVSAAPYRTLHGRENMKRGSSGAPSRGVCSAKNYRGRNRPPHNPQSNTTSRRPPTSQPDFSQNQELLIDVDPDEPSPSPSPKKRASKRKNQPNLGNRFSILDLDENNEVPDIHRGSKDSSSSSTETIQKSSPTPVRHPIDPRAQAFEVVELLAPPPESPILKRTMRQRASRPDSLSLPSKPLTLEEQARLARLNEERARFVATTKDMLNNNHGYPGLIDVEINFGKILIPQLPTKLTSISMTEVDFINGMDAVHSPDLQPIFIGALTYHWEDIAYTIKLTSVEPMLVKTSAQYELRCRRTDKQQIMLLVDAVDDTPPTCVLPRQTLGTTFFHFPQRFWDARVIVTGCRTVGMAQGEHALLASLHVNQASASGTPALIGQDGAGTGAHLDAIQLRQSAEYAIHPDVHIRVVLVRDLPIDRSLTDHAKFQTRAVSDEMLIQDQRLWYEVSLHPANAVDGDMAEETLRRMEQTMCALVEKMDCVGLNNRGTWAEKRAKAGAKAAEGGLDGAEVFW